MTSGRNDHGYDKRYSKEKYLSAFLFCNEPEGMDHARYPTEQGKENIDPEMHTDTNLEKGCNRRQDYGKYYFKKSHLKNVLYDS
jgi:hypothetical protein